MALRALVLMAAIGIPAVHAAPVEYTLDPAHTTVYFSASHFERSSVRGRFGKIDGRLVYDADSGAGAIDVTVDLGSVDTGNRTLDGVLRSAQFFDIAEHPVARLRADRFLSEAGHLAAVEGELTLHGVTRPVRLLAERFRCGEVTLFGVRRHVCGGDFRAEVPRSAFGMTRFLPEVGDIVTLQVAVEASPAASVPR
ncbi:YceI family protein [Cupriavidus alkaliphilus]|uniref:YceI family protein n=1 Tax=Cupriavidus alkaliphilus TaxID=942866 RepID=UPI0016129E35|nr:YceI family protein [Cupriavidus alkaliphilus]MBB2916188.1 polyisoprenoid-binding protein YceI [Cupriavidus alkaliphilus]